MQEPEQINGIRQFWKLQIIFWVSLGFISFLSLNAWIDHFQWRHAVHMLIQGILGLGLSFPLHIVFSILWESPLKLRIALSFVAVAMVAGLWNVFRVASFMLVTGDEQIWGAFGEWYFGGIYVFLCWTALYHGIRYYQLLQSENVMKLEAEAVVSEEKFKRLHAESEAKEAQLKMLRYQLNPHFLFNTLNAINSLVGTDEPKRAQKMIVQLSHFLRYSLDNNPEMKIPVERELQALSQYLEIEKTRFGERLRMEITIEDEAKSALIPSLLLQPLLENSMKHAIAKSESGGAISLHVSVQKKQLHIELSDSGPGVALSGSKIKSDGGRGIGLRNTVDRLKAFYGARFSFELLSNSSGGLRTVIQIPFECEQ